MVGEFSEVGVHIGITSDPTSKIDAIVSKLGKFGASQKYATQLNTRFSHLTKGLTNLTNKQEKYYKGQAATQVWSEKLGVSSKDLNKNMDTLGLGFTRTGKFASVQTGAMVNQQRALTGIVESQRKYAVEQKRSNALQGKAWQKAHMQRITETANKWGMSAANLSGALKTQNQYINEQGQVVSYATGKMLNARTAQARLTMASSRFKMELLSIMFFGMAMSRMLGALTAGSLEAAGAMSVWSTFTMLLGLPSAEKMTDAALWLLDAFDSLPGGVQTALSWGVRLTGWMAKGLMGFGQMALGVYGLMKLFPKFGAAVHAAGGIWPWFTGIMKVFAASTMGIIVGWVGAIGVGIWGLIDIFKGWGKASKRVGVGIMLVLASIAGIIAIIAGAPALVVAGLVLLGAFAIKLLAKWKPVGKFFEWLGKVVQGTVGGLVSFFKGKGWKAGWTKGFATMQAGGIVTRPTPAIIGERGPEAVIPLTKLGGAQTTIDYHPTLNIKANIAHDLDINRLARRLNEMLYSDLRRMGVR